MPATRRVVAKRGGAVVAVSTRRNCVISKRCGTDGNRSRLLRGRLLLRTRERHGDVLLLELVSIFRNFLSMLEYGVPLNSIP